MFGFDLSEKMTGSGLLEKLLGGGALAGLVALGVGIYKKRSGKDGSSPFDFLPEFLQKPLDGLANWINSMFDALLGWFRNTFSKDDAEAERDINARISSSGAFQTLETELGLPGSAAEVKRLTEESFKGFLGLSMSTDHADALDNAKGLTKTITEYLTDQLIKKNEAKLKALQPAERDALKEQYAQSAAIAASFITGTTEAETDPALITSGYAKMLMEVQTGTLAEGTYTAPSNGTMPVDNKILQQAKAALEALASGPTPPAPVPPTIDPALEKALNILLPALNKLNWGKNLGNKDGTLTSDEIPAIAAALPANSTFASLNTNNDTKLTAGEVGIAINKELKRRASSSVTP